tara:strand:- start:36 stop:785 length:750 start_codon:yes stop_codon:yes gene_type:complete
MIIDKGFIVVVDISGYTSFVKAHNASKNSNLFKKFLDKINDGHGELIISDLLETVINELDGTLTINKLEGDAALFYALPKNTNEFSIKLIKKLLTSIEVFNKRINELLFVQSCPCTPCKNMVNLKLKCFVHYGEFLIKKIRNFEEIAGQDVIILHRLMKNSINSNEYILFTEKASKVSDLRNLKNLEKRKETTEDFGKINIQVYYPSGNKIEFSKPNLKFKIMNFFKMQKYFWNKKREKDLREKYLDNN